MENEFKAVNWDEVVKTLNAMTRGYGIEFSHDDKYLNTRLCFESGQVLYHGKNKEELRLERSLVNSTVLNLVLESVFSGHFHKSLLKLASDYAAA